MTLANGAVGDPLKGRDPTPGQHPAVPHSYHVQLLTGQHRQVERGEGVSLVQGCVEGVTFVGAVADAAGHVSMLDAAGGGYGSGGSA